MNISTVYSIPFIISTITLSSACYAAPIIHSQDNFGGIGLLQTPTARMPEEGEFSLNIMNNDQYRFYSVSLQLFPWLETTIRYTDTRTRLYGVEELSGDQTHKDKGIDVKIRLLQENYWLPEVAIGVRDFGGTGLFDSEYLVANKAWGPLDFSLGIGWGYLGESGTIKNPFCQISNGFCERDNGFKGNGGSFDTQRFFRGPAALFGGIEYQTPWHPLRLKLEYDGNNYQNDFAGKLTQNSTLNWGAVYRPVEWADINISYQRGNTLMAGISLYTNFNSLTQHKADAAPIEYAPTPATERFEVIPATQQLVQLEQNAGYSNPTLTLHGNVLTLQGEQIKYRNQQEAITRASTILANQLPQQAKYLQLIDMQKNQPIAATQIKVNDLQTHLEGYPLGQEKPLAVIRQEPAIPTTGRYYQIKPEPWAFSWSPVLNQSFGGPEAFYMYQLGLSGSATYNITPDWIASTTGFLNLYNNYDKFNFTAPPPDSKALPNVRTHVRSYVDSGDLYLNNAQLTYINTLGNGWYGQAYAGYLEMMFGGVGAEVLYRPLDKPWAIGVDANWVQQRDWNNPLKFADYQVTTGHISTYWQLPALHNTTFKLSIGRYLAGDIGGTIDIAKQFDSGITAGSYATFTDVSAEAYGEGSFSKGFYVRIPLDLLTIKPTTNQAQFNWTPLTRDGGQPLNRKYSLYDITDKRSVSMK